MVPLANKKMESHETDKKKPHTCCAPLCGAEIEGTVTEGSPFCCNKENTSPPAEPKAQRGLMPIVIAQQG